MHVLFKTSKSLDMESSYKVLYGCVKFGFVCLMYQSIPSANIPKGFCIFFQPGSLDLYHLKCLRVARGSALLPIIISTKLRQLMPCGKCFFALVGPCFCTKILPWGRAFDYVKTIPPVFAEGGRGTLEIDA